MDNDKIQELLVSLQVGFAEIKSTLDAIKIELADSKNLKTDVAVMQESCKQAEIRIKKLEDSNTWLWRTIAAAIIVSLIALFLNS